ncbi:polyamine aminopropyltransferase [Frigoriglobus tundricola]|uniref:Uncharacterized protein n=1 Tax=Frigoriglobus tundricola TaxID=2774151 RepID=A0A6M5YQT4_9BACT|nr:hypothetical protein [Frigoriglobus tundricola]QJW96298.1 hypothetical protein FTUN_3855 [Frigoriglobus tundricola]
MRFMTVRVAVLVGLGAGGALIAQDAPPLHTEPGTRAPLVIEERATVMHLINRKTEKVIGTAGRYTYHRFLIGGTLHGSQARKLDNHILDDFQCLTAAHPWDNLAVLGALHTYNVREEPLTYHHRSGPIGAIYTELRTRKNGADAKAPVAVLGLTAGEEACYALRGQKMTFYETDPAVKKLVADTDKYFSYVTDARKRGAEIEIRVGNKRANLKADKDRKYALVVVDLAESFPFPTAIFTKEAVREYFDRMTDDGILALHISNKYIRLEPMFAKMAEELKLTARVWNDDAEGRHGKTASSWLVLARKREDLGERLCSPISDLMIKFGDEQIYEVLRYSYPELKGILDKNPAKQQETILQWLDKRPDDPQAKQYAAWIRKYGSEYESLMTVLQRETGTGFRPVRPFPSVMAWTDERADVFILWVNPTLQAVRGFFGYPTPITR